MSLTRTEWVERLTGFDPYDALLSPRVPRWMRGSVRGRQFAIQVRRRLPLELGPVLRIYPFIMAKSVACHLMAVSRQEPSSDRDSDIDALTSILYETRGNLGAGMWGYEFDVQTRWSYYPAGTPNLITTAFVCRALAEAGVATGRPHLIEQSTRSAEWIASSLIEQGAKPFVRYLAHSDTVVHNANLLGSACLAMVGSLAGKDDLVALALRCARRSVDAQDAAGAWPYGDGASLAWEDNIHTAFNLDALLTLSLITDDPGVVMALERGSAHWAQAFFGPDGEPYYEPNNRHPYDIHSASTAIDVGARLARHGLFDGALVERVAGWTRGKLVDASGYRTYARVGRVLVDKRHFVRWGDAHYALGLASLEVLRRGRGIPLEERLALSADAAPSASGGVSA